MKDIVFCTFITNDYKNSKVEFDLFYKSFKYFNPNLDLKVFEDEDIKKIFSKNTQSSKINWKCALAKELYNEYERVVVLDADHFIFSSLDEILSCDYDVAVPSNYNTFLNVKLGLYTESSDNNLRHIYDIVPYHKYYQGGLVCGTKDFWKIYDHACTRQANFSPLGENTILNLLLSIFPFNLKILDGAESFLDPNFKYFYNCSSLGLEKEFIVMDDKITCKGKQVKMYHVANGEGKKKFNNLFNKDVQEWFYNKIG